MKNMLLVLGLVLISGAAMADTPPFSCDLSYTLADGQEREYTFQSTPHARNFSLISQDVPAEGYTTANLYVYFNGRYSSINFHHEASQSVFSSDSEVVVGQMFSIFSRQTVGVFRQVNVNCRSTNTY